MRRWTHVSLILMAVVFIVPLKRASWIWLMVTRIFVRGRAEEFVLNAQLSTANTTIVYQCFPVFPVLVVHRFHFQSHDPTRNSRAMRSCFCPIFSIVLRRQSSNMIATILSTTPVAVYALVLHPFFLLPADHIAIIGHAHVVGHDVAPKISILAVTIDH